METAVCMLVIIPVFLYALFLDDLLRHTLDAQEAALSTVWDYTVQDYASPPKKPDDQGKFVGFGLVQGFARQMYCDHESGIDSFDSGKGRECEDGQESEAHHQEVVAHACWLNPGSQQVQCELSTDVGDLGVAHHGDYRNEFGRGGLIRCSGRLGVQNYLLQRKVFSQFSKVDLARDKQDKNSSVHANAQSGTYSADPRGLAGNVYLLPWERMSILTDTWALTRQVDIRPGTEASSGSGSAPASDVAGEPDDLYQRVLRMYEHSDNDGFSQMSTEAVNLVQDGIDSELFDQGLAITDSTPPGDDPRKPSMGIKPHLAGAQAPEESITQQGSSQSYFNSEWRDWDQNNNEQSYNARGNWYMGCEREESC